jgi:hypothetical protein
MKILPFERIPGASGGGTCPELCLLPGVSTLSKLAGQPAIQLNSHMNATQFSLALSAVYDRVSLVAFTRYLCGLQSPSV